MILVIVFADDHQLLPPTYTPELTKKVQVRGTQIFTYFSTAKISKK